MAFVAWEGLYLIWYFCGAFRYLWCVAG